MELVQGLVQWLVLVLALEAGVPQATQLWKLS